MKTKIQYTGSLSAEQLDALNTESGWSERDTPLIFKGRSQILKQIERNVANLKRSPPYQNHLLTTLIHGAPGSGKTSLLVESIRQHSEDSGITTIKINGRGLKSENQFLRAVLQAVDKAQESDLASKTTVKTGGGVNVVAFKGELATEHEYQSKIDNLSVKTIWGVLEDILGRDKVVLLCIDEAQTIQDEKGGARDLILDLHTGDTGKLRIIPVFAGLNDTEPILSGLGMSRPNEDLIFQLSSLSQREAEDVVLDTLNHPSFGMANCFSNQDKKLIATSLAIASDQWPRHLHYYVKGVLREVADDQELESPTYQIDLNRALEFGHEARVSYYDRRARLVSESFLGGLMTALANQPDNLLMSDLYASDKDFDNAIHYGLLEKVSLAENTSIRVPIPSLKTFLICRGDHEQTKQTLREEHEQILKQRISTDHTGNFDL